MSANHDPWRNDDHHPRHRPPHAAASLQQRGPRLLGARRLLHLCLALGGPSVLSSRGGRRNGFRGKAFFTAENTRSPSVDVRSSGEALAAPLGMSLDQADSFCVVTCFRCLSNSNGEYGLRYVRQSFSTCFPSSRAAVDSERAATTSTVRPQPRNCYQVRPVSNCWTQQQPRTHLAGRCPRSLRVTVPSMLLGVRAWTMICGIEHSFLLCVRGV
jgi:hypothetical protein